MTAGPEIEYGLLEDILDDNLMTEVKVKVNGGDENEVFFEIHLGRLYTVSGIVASIPPA